MHEEGGGVGGGCALACSDVSVHCTYVIAWVLDFVCFAGSGCFNVAVRVCFLSDGD